MVMRKFRMAVAVLIVLLLVVSGLFLAYSLPHHEVVRVSGHEVKRMDASGHFVDPKQAISATRDVFFIYAEVHTDDPQQRDVHVFRNEDTDFGFPWYFKFDSSEVQGRAQMLARDNTQLALVTYYGWRVPMLGMFPNAVDIRPWDRPEGPFPLFNTIFLGVLGLLVLTLWWKWRRWRQRRTAKA